MATKLRRLIINEGSLVDAPANPLARVMLFKREPTESGKEVNPTANESKRPSLLKRLFEGIAKMMKPGAMTMDQMMGMQEKQDELWENEWQMRDAFDSSVRSIMDDESMDMEMKKEMLGQTMEQYHAKLTEHMNAMMELMAEAKGNAGASEGAVSMSKTDPPANDPVNKKEGDDPMPVTYDEFLKSLPAEERAKVEADLAKRYAPQIPAEITKRLEDLEQTAAQVTDLQKRAEAAEKRADAAEEVVKAEQEARITREYLEKGAKFPTSGTPEQVAAKLRKAYAVSKEFGEEIEADLAKTEQLAEDAKLFQSVGKTGKVTMGSAEAQIEKLAQEKAKAEKISFEKAYDAVIQENRDLYKQVRAEQEGN